MSAAKASIAPSDALIALTKLASVGAGKEFNIDLAKLEKVSGRKLKVSTIIWLSKIGAETPEEIELVRVCSSALKAAS